MPTVNVPQLGKSIRFPDDMPREEIKRIIDEAIAKKNGDDGVNFMDSVQHGLKSGAAELIKTIPDYMAISRNLSPAGLTDRALKAVVGDKAPDMYAGQKHMEQKLRDRASVIEEEADAKFQPEGFAEKTIAGISSLPANIAGMAPALAMTAVAAPAGPWAPAIGFGLHGAIRGGHGELNPQAIEAGLKGGVEGAAYGFLPKGINKVVKGPAARKIAQQFGLGAIAGGSTAVQGGDTEDIAASAATMFALGSAVNAPAAIAKAKAKAGAKIRSKLEDVVLEEAKNNIQFQAPPTTILNKQELSMRVLEGWFDPKARINTALKAKGIAEDLSPLENPLVMEAGFYPSTASSQTRAAAKLGLTDPVDPQAAPRTKSFYRLAEEAVPKDTAEYGKFSFREGMYEFEKDFQAFIYATRNKEILKQDPSYKGITDSPDALLSALGNKYSPETIKQWKGAQGGFNDIGHFVVDFLKRAEVFDDTSASNIKRGNSYVNMGRFFDEADGRGVSGGNRAIWALKGGGKQKLNDLWVNTGSFVERAYRQANFQYYMKSLTEFLGDADPNMQKVKSVEFVKGMPKTKKTKTESETLRKIDKHTKLTEETKVPGKYSEDVTATRIRPMFDDRNHIVTFRRGGKPESWQMSKEWYESIRNSSTRPESWKIMDLTFGKAKRMATLGRTGLNPGFALITNTLRDLFTGALQSSDAGVLGQRHLQRVLETTIGRRLEKGDVKPITEARERYELSGARTAGPVEADIRSGMALRDQVLAAPEQFNIPRGAIKHPVEAARTLLAWTEDVNRFPEYYKMEQKYGAGTSEAFVAGRHAAQEITLNFARMGKYSRWANEYIPFFNASLQGARKFALTMKENPKAATIRAMSTITAPSMMLWAINKDDPRYQEIPAWEKGIFMHIIVPDGPIIRMPMPFEWFTIFGALPVAAIDAIYQKRPEILKQGIEQAFETLTPEIIPQFPKPLIEAGMNKDLFRNRKLESESMKRMIPSERYRESTPYIYRGAGKLTGTSPVKIQHLAESYTGGLIREPANLIDTVLGKDIKQGAGLPLANRLISNEDRQGQSVSDFYEKHESMQQAWNTARKKMGDGEVLAARGLLIRNADLLGLSRGEIELLVRTKNMKVPRELSRFNKARTLMSKARKRSAEAEELTNIARAVLGR